MKGAAQMKVGAPSRPEKRSPQRQPFLVERQRCMNKFVGQWLLVRPISSLSKETLSKCPQKHSQKKSWEGPNSMDWWSVSFLTCLSWPLNLGGPTHLDVQLKPFSSNKKNRKENPNTFTTLACCIWINLQWWVHVFSSTVSSQWLLALSTEIHSARPLIS